jgi:hypothetical protein
MLMVFEEDRCFFFMNRGVDDGVYGVFQEAAWQILDIINMNSEDLRKMINDTVLYACEHRSSWELLRFNAAKSYHEFIMRAGRKVLSPISKNTANEGLFLKLTQNQQKLSLSTSADENSMVMSPMKCNNHYLHQSRSAGNKNNCNNNNHYNYNDSSNNQHNSDASFVANKSHCCETKSCSLLFVQPALLSMQSSLSSNNSLFNGQFSVTPPASSSSFSSSSLSSASSLSTSSSTSSLGSISSLNPFVCIPNGPDLSCYEEDSVALRTVVLLVKSKIDELKAAATAAAAASEVLEMSQSEASKKGSCVNSKSTCAAGTAGGNQSSSASSSNSCNNNSAGSGSNAGKSSHTPTGSQNKPGNQNAKQILVKRRFTFEEHFQMPYGKHARLENAKATVTTQ